MQEFTQEQNINEKNQIYYSSQSEHSLIIIRSQQTQHSNDRKLQRCLDHVRQLTRSRKWKHKKGRSTSHSYWSRTHGPRGTTHGTSGRRPWRWMVPGELLLAAPILKRQRRRYREENGNSRSILGVSSAGTKYRPKGAPRGATGQPGGCLARSRVGSRQGPFWSPCGGPPLLPWCFRRLPGR